MMMILGLVKRFLLEGVCILIVLIFVFLKFYKEVFDVEEEEENYEWMNRFDVVLFIIFVFIVVISFFFNYSGFIIKKEIEVFMILFNILLFVLVVVLLVVGIIFVWKYLCYGEFEVELLLMIFIDSREVILVYIFELFLI